MARVKDERDEGATLHRVADDIFNARDSLTTICAKHLNGADPDLLFAKALQFWLKLEQISADQLRMAGYMFRGRAFASGRLYNAAALAIHDDLRSHDATAPYPMSREGLSTKTKSIIELKKPLSTRLSPELQKELLETLIRPLAKIGGRVLLEETAKPATNWRSEEAMKSFKYKLSIATAMSKNIARLREICTKHLNGNEPDLLFAKALQFWLKLERISVEIIDKGPLHDAAAIIIHDELRSHDTTTPYPMTQDGLSEKTKAIIASKTPLSIELSSELQAELLETLIKPLAQAYGNPMSSPALSLETLVNDLYGRANEITAFITAQDKTATRGTPAHGEAFTNKLEKILNTSRFEPMELICNPTVIARKGRILEAALTLAIRPVIAAIATQVPITKVWLEDQLKSSGKTDEDSVNRLKDKAYTDMLKPLLNRHQISIENFITFTEIRPDLVNPEIKRAVKKLHDTELGPAEEAARISEGGGGGAAAEARVAMAAGVAALRDEAAAAALKDTGVSPPPA